MDEDDKALFRSTQANTRPLKQKPRVKTVKQQTPASTASNKDNNEACTLPDWLLNDTSVEKVNAETPLFYAKPHLSSKKIRKLRRGDYNVSSKMDLHGMTVTAAQAALLQAIERIQQYHETCLHIVHGKGYGSPNGFPSLKNEVNRLLQVHPQVVAFSSATPKDGGNGAVYVLIKGLSPSN